MTKSTDQASVASGRSRRHFRHHVARWRAVPRRHHDLRGKARGRRLPRRDGRRHHRGRLPDRVGGRFRGRLGDFASGSSGRRSPGWRAPASKDIDRAGEAVKHARRGRIHTFVSTSPVHMKYKLQKTPEQVLDMVGASSARAPATWVDDVEWSAEDATRTEHDFLCRCVETAIKAGATTINIPDTVGYTVPEEYFALIRDAARARAQRRQGDLLDPLPQRPRHGGRQLAGRRQSRGAADRMHDQRHRRAGGQRGAGRGRDGDADAQGRAALRDRHRCHHADARLEARLGGHQLPGAVQQGDRRPQRLRARERHPPGRHAEAPARPTRS